MPEELSRQHRCGSGRLLRNRRGVVGLSLAAIGSLGVVALYQTGIIERVPEPPLPYLDADEVDAATEAYEVLEIPDTVLGIASYALTAVLAAGGEGKGYPGPLDRPVLTAKVAFDAAQAGKLPLEQWTEHRAFCLRCLCAAGASFATAPLVIPEAHAVPAGLVRR
ncbi:MAG: vitamin K epoxide reductase family protein [Actinomycetota bacterium]|nr:vitamin K epoxide reductase family protein [Actinomycetota bacterium]